MRILEYRIHTKSEDNEYNPYCKSDAKYGFTLAFKLYCEKCDLTDFVKISNTGLQFGPYSELMNRFGY